MKSSPASNVFRLAAVALLITALSSCATTWSSDPVAPAGKSVEQQAIDDAVGAPAWLIFDTQVTASWTTMETTAKEACMATLQGSTDRDFSAEYSALTARYDSAQASVLEGTGTVKAGYPATAPVFVQTQAATADWCAVPGLLRAAR